MTQSRAPHRSPIPKRLREARTRLGLSQASLGIEAGLDPSVASTRINQYEQGVHNPGFPTVAQLAAALKVPVPYLYCADDQIARLLLRLSGLSEKDLRALDDWLSAVGGPQV